MTDALSKVPTGTTATKATDIVTITAPIAAAVDAARTRRARMVMEKAAASSYLHALFHGVTNALPVS